MKRQCPQFPDDLVQLLWGDLGLQTMVVLLTLLSAGASMAFAVHQWWRGHHMIAIGFITFAYLIAGVAIEAAKNNQSAEATEVFQQP